MVKSMVAVGTSKTAKGRTRVPLLVEELQKKLNEVNSEKLDLMMENEELRHELNILRRKIARYFDRN